MSAEDLRRWFDGFERAAIADRDHRRAGGPHPARSIALALSLLDAARTAAGGRYPIDPRRSAGEAAARLVWARLRARVLP